MEFDTRLVTFRRGYLGHPRFMDVVHRAVIHEYPTVPTPQRALPMVDEYMHITGLNFGCLELPIIS